MEQIKFSDKDAVEFCKEFASSVTEKSILSQDKTTITTFLFHLIDKYSSLKFVENHNDFETANAFGMSVSKLKNVKTNVKYKFRQKDSKDVIIEFLTKATAKEKFVVNENTLELAIDDDYVKKCLESVLMENFERTVDYKNNRDIVLIEVDLFLGLVKKYYPDLESDIKGTIAKDENEKILKDIALQLIQKHIGLEPQTVKDGVKAVMSFIEKIKA